MQDLSVAFDTVVRGILMSCLRDMAGISGIASRWLQSFLTDNTQWVMKTFYFQSYHPWSSERAHLIQCLEEDP